MKIQTKIIKSMLIAAALLCTVPATFVQAQNQSTPQPTLEVFELQFERFDKYVVALETEIKELRQKIAGKTAKIGQLKEKEKPDFFQQQRLERLLKESQDLSNQVAERELKLRAAKADRQKSNNSLLLLYEKQITIVLQRLENKFTSAQQKEVFYRRLQFLRIKRQQISKNVGLQEVREVKVNELDISPDDSPKKIKQKADLLKDQEDKLRRHADDLHLQFIDLQNELDLRTRMGELVSDLSLFDQQDEVITDITPTGNSGAEARTEPADLTADVRAQGASVIAAEPGPVGPKVFDLAEMSSEQMEDVIEQLKKKQELATSRADSLAKRAKRFYQVAEERKKR